MTQVITLEEAKRIKEEFENGTLPLIDESIVSIDISFNNYFTFVLYFNDTFISIIYDIRMNSFEYDFNIDNLEESLSHKEISTREDFILTLKDIIDNQKEEAYD